MKWNQVVFEAVGQGKDTEAIVGQVNGEGKVVGWWGGTHCKP